MTELTELQVKMSEAIASGNVKAIEEIASEIVKSKSDRRKTEVAKELAEAEALAGVRAELAEEIRKACNTIPEITNKLEQVKANGFTYHRKGELDANGVALTKSSLGLLVPTIRKRSGGNGGAGKTKTDYGISLSEVFAKFATDEDKVKLADAEAKDKIASEKLGKSTNSNAWRIKNDVKKRAIAENLLAPVK